MSLRSRPSTISTMIRTEYPWLIDTVPDLGKLNRVASISIDKVEHLLDFCIQYLVVDLPDPSPELFQRQMLVIVQIRTSEELLQRHFLPLQVQCQAVHIPPGPDYLLRRLLRTISHHLRRKLIPLNQPWTIFVKSQPYLFDLQLTDSRLNRSYHLLKLSLVNCVWIVLVKKHKQLPDAHLPCLCDYYDLLNSAACDVVAWAVVNFAEDLIELIDQHQAVLVCVSQVEKLFSLKRCYCWVQFS